MTVTVQGYCQRILELSSSHDCPGYIGSQDAILNIFSTTIFSFKVHFLIKCLIVALDEVEVNISVLLCFLSAGSP